MYADAGRAEVTVLTLLELTASPAALSELRKQSDRPALAVVGLTHDVPASGTVLAYNEAIVVDQQVAILATGSRDGTVQLWDPATGTQLVTGFLEPGGFTLIAADGRIAPVADTSLHFTEGWATYPLEMVPLRLTDPATATAPVRDLLATRST